MLRFAAGALHCVSLLTVGLTALCSAVVSDHVITAKAIAENVQILPRGSPIDKAADCDIIRVCSLQRTETAEQRQQTAESRVR